MKTGYILLLIAVVVISSMRLQIKNLNHKVQTAEETLAEKSDAIEMKQKDYDYLKELAEKTQAVQIDNCEDSTKKVLVAKKAMENLQEEKAVVCSGIVDMPRYLQDPTKHFVVEENVVDGGLQAMRKQQ